MRHDLPFALSLLRLVLALLVGGSILGCVVAFAVFVGDSSRGGSGDWHGLIAGLALLALFVIVPVMLAAGALLWLIRRSPVTGAKLAVASGLCLCLLSLLIASALGTTTARWFLVAGLTIAVLGAVGVGQLRRR